jgi:hypothetical protein
MNSCACLLDPKKYPCVWCWFGRSEMGILGNGFIVFSYKLPTLSTFFYFVDLSGFGNGRCMKRIKRFEGLV